MNGTEKHAKPTFEFKRFLDLGCEGRQLVGDLSVAFFLLNHEDDVGRVGGWHFWCVECDIVRWVHQISTWALASCCNDRNDTISKQVIN
jgi:hypothetical protein